LTYSKRPKINNRGVRNDIRHRKSIDEIEQRGVKEGLLKAAMAMIDDGLSSETASKYSGISVIVQNYVKLTIIGVIALLQNKRK
jgi:hypothetical protein